jgi:N-acetylglucosaminyldiphosphoundecaprenol N-acetyl-beta-D-mannosaminyltransferase
MQPKLNSPLETTLFGIRVCVASTANAIELVLAHARKQSGGLVCVANVDMLTRARRTPRLAALMQSARLVVTDGMPLVWALRRLQGWQEAERVYGPGLVLQLCERAQAEGLSVYFLGGSPDEAKRLEQRLRQLYPALRIAGVESPPMLPNEPGFDAETVARINASGAHLLFVGLGCPKQEFWMDTHQHALRPVALGVGLAFALIAGTKSQAPEWMRRNGLEWLYRLVQEPGRLWKRYLVGNSAFLWQVVRSLPKPSQRSR